MARRTKEDAQKTRESLLDAAETVFLRRGVTLATLEEIAKEAGVTRGALYWHFENKISIFRAMHERVKQPLDIMFEQMTAGDDPLEGLRSMISYVLNLLGTDEHARNVFTILRLRSENTYCADSEYGAELEQKQKEVYAKFERIFRQIHQHHPLADGIDPTLAAIALHSFISGVFWDYLRNPQTYPITTAADTLVQAFFRGILCESINPR